MDNTLVIVGRRTKHLRIVYILYTYIYLFFFMLFYFIFPQLFKVRDIVYEKVANLHIVSPMICDVGIGITKVARRAS